MAELKNSRGKGQDERVIAVLMKMTGDPDSVREALGQTKQFSADEMQKLIALLAAHRRRVTIGRPESERAS